MTFRFLTVLMLTLLLTLTAGNGYALRLKIATLSPEGSMWMQKIRGGIDEVAKRTDNRVTFKIYPGGVMGNDKAVLRKIRIGQLHGGALMSGSLSQFFPANQLYSQPLKFKNLEEVAYVRRHMDQFIIDGLDKAGFVTFGLTGIGFAYIMSIHPIESVQDLKAQKVWIPDSGKNGLIPTKSFGVSPIPLPLSDVRTGLQSGLINTVATTPVGAVILQWHTRIKYIVDLPFIYLHAVLAIDKKKYLKISEQDRMIVSEVMTRALHEIDAQSREDDLKAIQALKNRGIKFITPSGKDLEVWHKTAKAASLEMVESKTLTREIVDKMDAHLADFRSSTHTTNDQ